MEKVLSRIFLFRRAVVPLNDTRLMSILYYTLVTVFCAWIPTVDTAGRLSGVVSTPLVTLAN